MSGAQERRPLWSAVPVSVAVALTLTTVALPAQAFAGDAPAKKPAQAEDEVRLHSGGFMVGEISEYMPGEYVVIIPRNSSEARRFEWSEVASVKRGGESKAGSAAPEPTPIPDPVPEVVPEPVPEVVPEPVPEQSAIPEGVVGGVVGDSVDGHAMPMEAPDEAAGTAITLTLPADAKTPIFLYRIEGEAYGASSGGGTVHAIAYSEICESPCLGRLEDTRGEFFVGGGKYRGSKRFRLMGNAGAYDIQVKPKPKWFGYLGWGLTVVGVVTGAAMITTPILVDMPKSAAKGWYAGAGILGGGMFIGGMTLSFSRSKVVVVRH